MTNDKQEKNPLHGMRRHSWQLMGYDAALLLLVDVLFLVLSPSAEVHLSTKTILVHFCLSFFSVFLVRILSGVYTSVWRYAGTRLYLRLLIADLISGLLYYALGRILPLTPTAFTRSVSIIATNLAASVFIRLVYQYLYDYRTSQSNRANLSRRLLRRMAGIQITPSLDDGRGQKINVAIVGAGSVGVQFAMDLLNNPHAAYTPVCFIDRDPEKIGRKAAGLTIYGQDAVSPDFVHRFPVQEFVFALPDATPERKKELYERYKAFGCRIRVYDYPVASAVEKGRRQLREFDVEELLFRQPQNVVDDRTRAFYSGKTILVTGGGGSIGSELARQLAAMGPKKLIILDVYENAAYDLQQELRMIWGDRLELAVEIVTVCDRGQLERVFAQHRPDVVIHAAAHKHVPLMQTNACECIKNNVFGTLNVVDCCEKYGVRKAIMVSTDKAVNPTNVMGASKRMCEMIFQSRRDSATSFSCTRFGNVLGSNGSVIPLFKRQIANGGPVTLTDKRIIRYFMTIPEASQLVLQSGAMAQRGELFVLDMGKPVRILDLAESMIRLSGFEPYRDIDIVEIGLRSGEKLYEELLIKTEELDTTDRDRIFIERDEPLSREAIREKLALLREAAETSSDSACMQALKQAVPTYRSPDEVNTAAESAEEMKMAQAQK